MTRWTAQNGSSSYNEIQSNITAGRTAIAATAGTVARCPEDKSNHGTGKHTLAAMKAMPGGRGSRQRMTGQEAAPQMSTPFIPEQGYIGTGAKPKRSRETNSWQETKGQHKNAGLPALNPKQCKLYSLNPAPASRGKVRGAPKTT